MRAVFPLRRLASAGLLFDFAGYYPAAVHARIQQRREQRANSFLVCSCALVLSIKLAKHVGPRRITDGWMS